jgi:Flp pilus assembly pilin Flp
LFAQPSLTLTDATIIKTSRVAESPSLGLLPTIFQPWSVLQNERKKFCMSSLLPQLWNDDAGQDIAEYAVMLAVILVLVVGTIRLVGSNANNVFSSVASVVQ